MAHISVTKIFEFEACHHIPNYKGDCARMHGHSYKLEVTVTSYKHGVEGCVDETGMILDFKTLKEVVKETILNYVDHTDLNTLYENPTAEVMVADFHSKLVRALPVGIIVESVRLWETSTSYATIS